MVARIESLEARRSDRSIREVRMTIARQLKTGVGTLANIRKQRRKTVPAWLMRNIGARLIESIQTEIRALEHEMEITRQIGVDPRDDTVCAVAASLASAKALLKQAVKAK
jgi:hypothetical protein